MCMRDSKIEGVGPAISKLLNKAGIHTFNQLSNVRVNTLKGILDKAGNRFQMHDPGTWVNQAKLAASGSWDKLKKLQDELSGGKK